MRNRVADRNDEARIGKQPAEIGDPRDVVVALRNVAFAASEQQDFSNVIAKDDFELRCLAGLVDDVIRVLIVDVRKEELPQGLLERLGAVGGDVDSIAMRPLDRSLCGRRLAA